MAIGEIEIASYTYQELAAAWGADMTGIDGPIDGTFYATGEFGNPPYEGPAQYQDMEITLPGVDGIGIKRMGFRGRPIFVRMVFVGATKSACEGNKDTFFSNITGLSSFSIKLPGGTTRPSCRIVHGSAENGQWQYAGGMMMLLVDVQFKQMRLT
jgi:hypothetical protein